MSGSSFKKIRELAREFKPADLNYYNDTHVILLFWFYHLRKNPTCVFLLEEEDFNVQRAFKESIYTLIDYCIDKKSTMARALFVLAWFFHRQHAMIRSPRGKSEKKLLLITNSNKHLFYDRSSPNNFIRIIDNVNGITDVSLRENIKALSDVFEHIKNTYTRTSDSRTTKDKRKYPNPNARNVLWTQIDNHGERFKLIENSLFDDDDVIWGRRTITKKTWQGKLRIFMNAIANETSAQHYAEEAAMLLTEDEIISSEEKLTQACDIVLKYLRDHKLAVDFVIALYKALQTILVDHPLIKILNNRIMCHLRENSPEAIMLKITPDDKVDLDIEENNQKALYKNVLRLVCELRLHEFIDHDQFAQAYGIATGLDRTTCTLAVYTFNTYVKGTLDKLNLDMHDISIHVGRFEQDNLQLKSLWKTLCDKNT